MFASSLVADAAEQRAAFDFALGIGDIDAVQQQQAQATSNVARGVDGSFGAGRSAHLRKRLRMTRSSTKQLPPSLVHAALRPSSGDGCTLRCANCGRAGHASNSDPLCAFFGRARGELPWAPQHPDTAWGNNVPHISETRIRVFADNVEQMAARKEHNWYRGKVIDIDIEGVSYHMGTATGDGCNCLIDTLRQTLPVIGCNVSIVRSMLEERHCNLPTAILPGDYLSLDLWYDIIDLLFACTAVDHTKQRNQHHNYRVVCVDMTWIGSGDVFPRNSSADGRRSLAIARVNENHFVPLHRLDDRNARWRRPEPRS